MNDYEDQLLGGTLPELTPEQKAELAQEQEQGLEHKCIRQARAGKAASRAEHSGGIGDEPGEGGAGRARTQGAERAGLRGAARPKEQLDQELEANGKQMAH